MKQKCIRCVVQLSLAQLHWVDNDEISIHLEGPPLFVRACILGQLQHSHLHKPVFPVCLDQELTFDRVLTNCRNPSLFNEVIRGEHIKIELIQVASDYKGGKILARFETPAHRFLFPEVPPAKGEQQQIELDKSRKYQNPPVLTYTCSSTLLETTLQSPVDVIFNESQLDQSSRPNQPSSPSSLSSSSSESDNDLSADDAERTVNGRLTMSALDSSRKGQSTSSRRLFQSERQTSFHRTEENSSLAASDRRLSHSQPSLVDGTRSTTAAVASGSKDGYGSAREKLHSLLESFSRPENEGEHLRAVSPKPVYRVKFKPPVPRFGGRGHVSASSQQQQRANHDHDVEMTSFRQTTPTYQSPTVGLGPHQWEDCPRRSPKRIRSQSLPSSPVVPRPKMAKQCPQSLHERLTTVPNQIPLDRLESVHLECGPPDLTPPRHSPHHHHGTLDSWKRPFVVGHADPKLISRRNFCGEVGVRAVCHAPSTLTSTARSCAGGAERRSQPLLPTVTMATTTDAASGRSHWREGVAESLEEDEEEPLHVGDITDSESDDGGGIGIKRDSLLVTPEDIDGALPVHKRTELTSDRSLKSEDIRSSSLSRSPQPRPRSTSPALSRPLRFSRSQPTTPAGKRKSLQSSRSRSKSKSSHRKRDLVSKYLLSQPGNVRKGVVSPPSKVIVEKIQRLRDECCACLRSADSLGEDDLSEDLERLKASLEAEREETLNKSARLIPDKNVTVQIGPRDYWSRRMSEYTGKRHRVLFDETLEKIYNRLYRDATNSSSPPKTLRIESPLSVKHPWTAPHERDSTCLIAL